MLGCFAGIICNTGVSVHPSEIIPSLEELFLGDPTGDSPNNIECDLGVLGNYVSNFSQNHVSSTAANATSDIS